MAKQTFTTGQVLTAVEMTSLQQTAMGGGSTTAKTLSYVLVAADAGTVVQMNAAGATTITVNTALFSAGDTVQIQNVGAGVCTITAGTATVSTSAVLTLKQYDAGTLYFNTTSAAIFFAVDAADSPLTTKGDLYTYSTVNDRLGVGNNGETLVADSSTSTGLRYQANFAAGKNKIINGDFGIWQRGTTFTNPATAAYTADRWQVSHDGTGATRTVSQQTFTPGTAPVAGYEGQYFYRYAVSVAGTGNTFQDFRYTQEDVRTFAGQTVTISFWGKADASRGVSLLYRTDYGSGGSSANQYTVGSVTLTTSWVRYTVTYAVPSVSGLTIGSGSFSGWVFRPPALTAETIDVWGVQIEAGSVATAFQTATGTIQGELAACQRYYWRTTPGAVSKLLGNAQATSTTSATAIGQFPVTMRTAPTALEQNGTANNYAVLFGVTTTVCSAVPTVNTQTTDSLYAVTFTVTAGLVLGQAGRALTDATNGATAYLGWSAEL